MNEQNNGQNIDVRDLQNKIYEGYEITKEDAMALISADLEELATAANEIREHFCGNTFDICTIINGKSGKCSENCKFCAQSAFYSTDVETYPLLACKPIIDEAKYNADRGVLRYSIVTSGKRISDDEVDAMCETIKELNQKVDIKVCVSFGLLGYEQFAKLKAAGATRVHNNLETSARNFPNVCTTHTYQEKMDAIAAAKAAGLSVCSGGLFGMGETMEDRIDMAIAVRSQGVNSIPVNMLSPIPGTPFEHLPKLTSDDMRRICAIFRFIAPTAAIRLAGGRGALADKGRSCFLSGANAAISGDMLTTSGYTIESDMAMIAEMGYKTGLNHM